MLPFPPHPVWLVTEVFIQTHLMPDYLKGLAYVVEFGIGAALVPIVVMDSLLSLRLCLAFACIH